MNWTEVCAVVWACLDLGMSRDAIEQLGARPWETWGNGLSTSELIEAGHAPELVRALQAMGQWSGPLSELASE
jgi:hypothetical protein